MASDFYQEEEGTLTIAATNTQARYVLPEILRKLRQQYPKLHLNLHQGTSDQVAGLMAGTEVDFTIASGSDYRFGSLLQLPAYQWDRVIVVPNDHDLTKVDRPLTLHDLANYPLVSYVFSFEAEQTLRDTFAKKDLKPDIVFSARDSDVVKTYVRMGAGIGILASMAFEHQDRKYLTAIPVNGLFPRSTVWVGMRRNTMLRCYMADFLQLFASHLNSDQIERITRATDQHEVNQLIKSSGLPLKNGFGNKLSAAA